MHVITRRRLLQFASLHVEAGAPLDRWFRLVKQADWTCFADVREDFPHADHVGDLTIFNIGGNKFRLLAEVNFRLKKVFIRHVLTHTEYDQGSWKTSRGS